jgi:hypothetical protein
MITLYRLEDWEPRLVAAIDALREQPHDWVTHNCAHVADALVRAQTGAGVLGDALAGCASEADVRARLAELGGLAAAITARLGEPRAGLLLARQGDVALAPIAGDDGAVGVVVGAHAVISATDGLTRVRLRDCLRVWAVG